MTAAVDIDMLASDHAEVEEKPFLARVRLRAQRRVLWMRSLWSDEESGSGLAISHAEVDRVLVSPAEMAGRESEFYQRNPHGRELTARIREADDLDAKDPAWHWLRQFGLSKYETDLLALCIASEVDPPLRRVYAYLHDDATAGHVTPWLASGLFQWPPAVELGPQSPLFRWHIARPTPTGANPWAAIAPWAPDPHIVLWMTQGPTLDPALGTAVHVLHADQSQEMMCLYPAQLDLIKQFVLALRGVAPVAINLVGAKGAGKRVLAAQVAAALGRSLIAADAGLLLGGDVSFSLALERAIRAARLASLAGALLYWQDAETANPKIWSAAFEYCPLMLLGSQAPLPRQPGNRAARRSIALPHLTRSARMSLWTQITGQPASECIASSLLEASDIVNAARLAPAGPECVANACNANLPLEPSELFVPMPCPYTWEDLVLPGTLRDHLKELERQVRLRWDVYDEWGFGRLRPLGRGITAMFAGPSGTGKTMAAQVLAGALGMKLYRVDLAGVINKYIGETEKRLRQVFDVCERANVILFFDEADALFGQRTQVKDAHDRFANIEIDYLLQRMEQFDGVAILATNRKGDLDKAFLRRIRFIVDFIPPGPAERLQVWQRALPFHSPTGEELLDNIDWEFLADKLNLTGADITAAALGAAFLARAEGTRIGMTHIMHAAHREIGKHGILLRSDGWGGK
jgi:AAA+ superfamily predicted ATPase